MGWVDAHPVPLPFGGKSPRSKQASYRGAQRAQVQAGSQASRMLQNYAAGPVSDTDMAYWLGLPEARVSARRCGLMVKGLVRYYDEVMGMHGVMVCRWELTEHGARIARGLSD